LPKSREPIVTALVSPVVALFVAILGLEPLALTARATACYELPANIHAAAELRLPIARLLARSRTLRAQCATIAAAGRTQVTIRITMAAMDSYARARSLARRYDSGLLIVDIQIPPAAQDFTELLAHELEHATEIIERLDFAALAGTDPGPRVDRRPDGSFESDRATRAGRAAAAEADMTADPAVSAVGQAVAGAARGLARHLRF
jgi:hypothetical protein